MIEKKELRYIFYSVGFALIYFFLVLPLLIKKFDGDNPLLQFLIFNIGIMVFLTIYLKSRSLDSKIDFKKALEYTLVVMAIDIWLPEYHVNFLTGQLQIGGTLGISTTDYIFGLIGQNYLHLKGIINSLWTYIVVPAALLFTASRLSKSNFVKSI